ncbi:MAG: carbamoyltransferase HypF [Gemmatimonadota bacterium]|nr:carbamoyltransferase HypF [Gemmatimonadota bacterium]
MTTSPPVAARRLRVTGIVQGVGFRPFVYRIAARHGLAGWVRNVAGTVEIHVEGPPDAVHAFEHALVTERPPVASIERVEAMDAAPDGAAGFSIAGSADAAGYRPVPPDVATCASCERELRDPSDRRYRHPFITCTDCGPRYSVIEALPYDRERTTMAAFPMCERCRAEYEAPGDRRHHAETVACNACGPQLWLCGADGVPGARGDEAIRAAAGLLALGRILAVRGVGGFHLACDATNQAAVLRLRARKGRNAKPLAVMVASLDDASLLGAVTPEAARLLTGPERPIVLLPRKEGARLAAAIAPGIAWVGVMLAYTPLHHLLLEAAGRPLVMTSGNLSDEPIAIGNAEALHRLAVVADHFLLHDREILSRVDDSVVRVVGGAPVLLRRGRGFAPLPLALPLATPRPLVAVGPHLKNTFTLASGARAFVSPHIGDLESVESVDHWRATFERYRELFRVDPEVAVRDLHPAYLSTRLAGELGLGAVISVQHHHAHVAAVMAEHGVTTPVVGVALDGTGYGDDGRVWGAEVLVADLTAYARKAHLAYAPLPGGDAAAREPWRVAAGYLARDPGARGAFARAFDGVRDAERAMVARQLERGLNAPEASSAGRLFDAAAAILGVHNGRCYEGQAAMELESLAGAQPAAPLPLPLREANGVLEMDPLPMLVALGERCVRGDDRRDLAAAFHESVILAFADAAARVATGEGIGTVALGGGSFQNARLLAGIRAALELRRLRVLTPRSLSPNDGALSYGQAAIGAALLVDGLPPTAGLAGGGAP